MIFGVLALGLVFLGLVLWFLLERHEKRRAVAGRPRHSALRLVFAAAGLLVMLLSAGCALIIGTSLNGFFPNMALLLIFAAGPFLAGLAFWWLAMRRRKDNV